MRFKVGNKIFLRVFTGFGTLVLAITMVIALMIIPWQQRSLQQIMYTQAITISQSIVQACSDAMISQDFSFIVEHNVDVLENNSGIRYVMVSPLRGELIWIEPKHWQLLDEPDQRFVGFETEQDNFHFIAIDTATRVYHFVYPVRFSGIEWGWLHIGFSTEQYDKYISNMYQQLLIIAGVSILIILLFGYFFARWITLPVARISQLATQVAKGDLSVKSEIDRDDEMGVLSKSFNQMVLSLKDSKEHLEHYNEELEQEVARRTQQLDELNHSLDQRVKDEVAQRQKQEELLIHQSRLAAMGEMIGAIAHQWRQPLNALGLVLQNIELTHKRGKLDDDFMSRSLEKSERLINKMSTTIDDFRNFFKPNKHAERFYICEVIDSVTELLDATLRNSNISLTLDCDSRLSIKGFQGEFSQVMLNLLNNAKDTLQERKTPAPKINIEVKRHRPGRILVKVSDNAGGIPEQIRHKIYDPYFSTRPEGKGTGIGLYMSKMIVENNMNGSLKAYNDKEGAVFVIEIPELPFGIEKKQAG
ncbi:MAG: sensor histidine kinase [Gammaproteobacteria bacterium]